MHTPKTTNPQFGDYSFEELVKIAESNPEKLEKIRQKLVDDAISSAPEEYQARLKGLQFELITKAEKIKNPLSRAAFMTNWAMSRQLDMAEACDTGKDPLKKEDKANVISLNK